MANATSEHILKLATISSFYFGTLKMFRVFAAGNAALDPRLRRLLLF